MKDTQHSWVKHLVDWGPLAAFFIAFKVGGIMQANVVLIVFTFFSSGTVTVSLSLVDVSNGASAPDLPIPSTTSASTITSARSSS